VQQSPSSISSNFHTNYHFLRSNSYGKSASFNNENAVTPVSSSILNNVSNSHNVKSIIDHYLTAAPSVGPSASSSSSSQPQTNANRGSSSSHNYTTYSSGYSGSNYANSAQVKPSFVSSISFRNNNNNNNASAAGNSNANAGNQYERILTSLNQNNLGTSAAKTNNFLTSTSTSGPNYSPSNYSSNVYDTLNYSSYLQNELKNQQFAQQQHQTLVGPTYASSRSKSVSIYDIVQFYL